MIAYRDGHPLQMCDGCYRVRRSGEPGWGSFPSRFPEAQAHHGTGADEKGPKVHHTQPEQEGHLCGACSRDAAVPTLGIVA